MPFIQFQVILVVSQAFEPMVAHAAMPLAQRLVKLSDCSSNNKGAWMDTDWWYRIMYCQVQYKTDESLTLLGAVSIRKTVLPGMAIPMLKIRRPNGRLIFNMEIAICR